MKKREPMVCQDCGVELNYHAEKINYAATLEHPEHVDPVLGGVVEEAHSCPGCGKTETRIASAGDDR